MRVTGRQGNPPPCPGIGQSRDRCGTFRSSVEVNRSILWTHIHVGPYNAVRIHATEVTELTGHLAPQQVHYDWRSLKVVGDGSPLGHTGKWYQRSRRFPHDYLETSTIRTKRSSESVSGRNECQCQCQ